MEMDFWNKVRQMEVDMMSFRNEDRDGNKILFPNQKTSCAFFSDSKSDATKHFLRWTKRLEKRLDKRPFTANGEPMIVERDEGENCVNARGMLRVDVYQCVCRKEFMMTAAAMMQQQCQLW